MKLRITHRTAYSYSEPASLSQNEVFLHPRQTATQQVAESRLTIRPEPQYLRRRTDYFGNIVHVFMVQQPHTELTVTAESRVATSPPAVPPPAATLDWEEVVRRLALHATPPELEACRFLFASPMARPSLAVRDYGRASFPPGMPVLSGAIDLMRRIHAEFAYDKSATTVDTPVDQFLSKRRGVCQDFAHLGVSCLRAVGLAARYVSGYLKTSPPPNAPALIGADASHAWISLFVPDAGWVDLDPTNDLIPSDAHITLAWGRDYGDVTPAKGVVMGGGTHTLSVAVEVAESPD
jgi:transglutaminase-like putative cysteine protease